MAITAITTANNAIIVRVTVKLTGLDWVDDGVDAVVVAVGIGAGVVDATGGRVGVGELVAGAV